MERLDLPGDPPVEVWLRRAARARRLTLRVSQLDGRVTLTMPERVTSGEVDRFLADRADWVRRHLDRLPDRVAVGPGIDLPVEGVPRRIEIGAGRKVQLDAAQIAVPAHGAGRRIEAVLKARARDRLAAACDRHATALDRTVKRLTLRDPRSRWGSCTADGALMFSWRLILAPPDILDYVAAHEVAHLAEMNHGPDFWALVHRLYGDHRPARAWLRAEGAGLHRFDFRAE